MKYLLAAGLLLATAACTAAEQMSAAERESLEKALSQTTNSPLEIARTLEQHLKKYPNSPERPAMERQIIKSALESGDSNRIVEYGERVLKTDLDQPQILERVAEILINRGGKEQVTRALGYAQKFEGILRSLEKTGPSSRRNRGRMLEELDKALGRALLLQARAQSALDQKSEALALANRSFTAYPSAAAARELGRQLELDGKNLEAVRWLALAFTAEDSSEADRKRDRVRMATLYQREKGSETGLGDVVLQAWDQMSDERAKLQAKARERDPNNDLTDAMEFTLTGVDGPPMRMATLRGKVVVLDFWATWCGPCRTQHPLYEQVAKRFADRDDVVFLAINTDEEPSVVKPFLEKAGWKKGGYLEDGLSMLFRVTSIPTTIVLGKDGQVFSRMNGFVPEKFVEQLTGVIQEAVAK